MSRNFGCRIKQYQMGSTRVVSLENNLLRVGFLLSKGADVFEFCYKPKDVDFMWRSHRFDECLEHFRPIQPDCFLDWYEGGWQELFPNIGKGCEVDGVPYGMHGEAALLPWKMEIIRDDVQNISVLFHTQLLRTPFRLQRTVTLKEGEAVMHVEEQAANLGTAELRVCWGHHPALGGNFLDESCRIRLEGAPEVEMYARELGNVSPAAASTRGRWPYIRSRTGAEIDLSKVLPYESNTYMEFALSKLTRPRYEVHSAKHQLAFGMEWDQQIFPYVWAWQMFGGNVGYPFYGRAYTLALEPWSAVPGCMADVLANGGGIRIGPGETVEHVFDTFASCG